MTLRQKAQAATAAMRAGDDRYLALVDEIKRRTGLTWASVESRIHLIAVGC